jgi:hypothetical protein
MRGIPLAICLIAGSMLTASPALAMQPRDTSDGVPQFYKVAQLSPDKSFFTVQYTTMVPVNKQVEKTVIVNGQAVKVLETITVYETQTRESRYDLDKHRFYNGKGKTLTREAALARIKAGGYVLIAPDSQPVSQAYLDVIDEKALIVAPLGK